MLGVIRLSQTHMGWSTDWLYLLLLERARDTFAEAVRAANERSEERPKLLLASEHKEWNRESTMPCADPIRIWSSEDDFKSLIDVETWQSLLQQEQDFRQSIHSVPLFTWFITDDRKQVLICRWIGPRYGNGGWWDIIDQGPVGKLEQANRRAWIS